MPNEVWDEIAYPLLNLNGFTAEVSEWISEFIPHLKSIHINKRGLWKFQNWGQALDINSEYFCW